MSIILISLIDVSKHVIPIDLESSIRLVFAGLNATLSLRECIKLSVKSNIMITGLNENYLQFINESHFQLS